MPAQLQPGLGAGCCCGGYPPPNPCLGGCTLLTAHFAYGLTLDTGFTNGTCTDCTQLNGISVVLTQDPGNPCVWTYTLKSNYCTYYFSLTLNGGFVEFGISSTPALDFIYAWGDSFGGPIDCSSITLPYLGPEGAPQCDPHLTETHSSVTLTGL